MAKKSAAARIEAPAPTTVAERRRQLRAAKADAGPGLAKVEVDLTKPEARKTLTSLYPRPTSDAMLDATAEIEAAALEYIAQRDIAKVANAKKDIAGNVLCNAIGRAKGICGDGWKATWDMSKGNVDWTALASKLSIPDSVIAEHRKPESRGLDVKEVAEEA